MRGTATSPPPTVAPMAMVAPRSTVVPTPPTPMLQFALGMATSIMAMGGSVYGNDVDGDDTDGDGNGSDGEGYKVSSKKDRVHFKEDLMMPMIYIYFSISRRRTCVSENLWTSSPL